MKKLSKRRIFGTFVILVGTALIITSFVLLLRNIKESSEAGDESAKRLALVQREIASRVQETTENTEETEENTGEKPEEHPGIPNKMTIVSIEGDEYIGYLTMPTIGLEMPVMAKWNYLNLKKALCRHYGSAEEGNLVIAGHNYSTGFGKLRDLNRGDNIFFTDMNGVTRKYTVGEIEVLNPGDIDKMIRSKWNLSLYTCTYNSKQRITVRCEEDKEEEEVTEPTDETEDTSQSENDE